MADLSWVIGAGGLLGSAVVRELASAGSPVIAGQAIRWAHDTAGADIEAGLMALVNTAGRGRWQVYWCAGAAVTGSDAESLDRESRTFDAFLDAVAGLPREHRHRGSIVFASSAGAVYGGSSAPPFDEASNPAPLGLYGEAKLRAEDALRHLCTSTGVPVFIARIGNLYGPGQNLAKQQGIISKLCFSTVTRTPVAVFVALDTLRDYIYVDDCARVLVQCGSRIEQQDAVSGPHLKVVGSGRAVSIAAVIGEFRLIGGPQPLVVMGTSRSASFQSRDLRLRSMYWTDLGRGPSTSLLTGISRTIAAMRLEWMHSGRFPGSLRGASLG